MKAKPFFIPIQLLCLGKGLIRKSPWPAGLWGMATGLFFSALLFPSTQARGAGLTLATKGASSYQIVIATNALPSERYAAEELQQYLQKITAVKLPIVTDADALQGREILIGDNAHLRKLGVIADD